MLRQFDVLQFPHYSSRRISRKFFTTSDFRIDLKLTAREIVAQLMASLEFGFYEAAKFSSLIEAAGQSTFGKADGQKAIWTKGRKRGSADWQSFDERSTSKESFLGNQF